jgi:hypothetical protein
MRPIMPGRDDHGHIATRHLFGRKRISFAPRPPR